MWIGKEGGIGGVDAHSSTNARKGRALGEILDNWRLNWALFSRIALYFRFCYILFQNQEYV